ncbi:subclass B1 metallo-beta-lactamase [Pontibacter sp. G13]|uniref:subclass B1 metallo-beta-lactamase n=1 Tax=Pontibacter sp. G13 TaxID=3074898 RepID=UPI00288B5B3C|nr:subclass B1 metallo-beta-lactamase [Pontibacter sp. G13]WNJ18367.1 subclass B1 metallo-beta-lactamase [Pontibacter sp. G13]
MNPFLRILSACLLAIAALFLLTGSYLSLPTFSDQLVLEPISKHTYLHISYLNTQTWGKVPCNGMVVVDDGQALILDAPVDSAEAIELVQRIEDELNAKVIGVVSTHFHIDCVGGLPAFHTAEIPSFGTTLTQKLAHDHADPTPQETFEDEKTFQVGGIKVIVKYLGPGHTQDNVVAYVPKDRVLFGGCLLKADGAGKGNLADADVKQWPLTIRKVQSEFKKVKVVIPGHGKPGGPELLDYTAELFAEE